MKPEEINRAIAEECLYYVIQDDSGGAWKLVDPNPNVWWAWTDSAEHAWSMAPEYYTDLNAIHEAWQIEPPLPFKDSFNFRHELAWQLSLVVERDYNKDPFWKDRSFPSFKDLLGTGRDYWISHASAPQRAEAFLRTIGKWRDNNAAEPA